MIIQSLNNVPKLDGLETLLVYPGDAAKGDCYIGQRAVGSNDEPTIVALYDSVTGNGYETSAMAKDAVEIATLKTKGPQVRMVGSMDDTDGQVTILQEEGHYRRYSRWDRISETVPGCPHAILRTLPQCGCGGYLGAPMLFDSFAEMVAYFFVVFADAAAVNAKHSASMRGLTCSC